MPKGTSRDEVTSNSKKIKPLALAIIKLRAGGWAGGRVGGWVGRQAGGRAGRQVGS